MVELAIGLGIFAVVWFAIDRYCKYHSNRYSNSKDNWCCDYHRDRDSNRKSKLNKWR